MYFATMVMHRPDDKPKHLQNILILIKGQSNFKIGGYADDAYYLSGDFQDDNVNTDNIDMWCDMPTRETVKMINKL